MSRFLLAYLTCVLVLPASSSAQPFVEHLEPPVLERGKTTRLVAVGSHLARAQGLWTSLPAGKIEATAIAATQHDKAAFDVRVGADAPVGLFGVRVATAGGLSNIHLCLIDDLPVRRAPDSAKAPAKVSLPCALWGRFREAQVDRFAIEVKAGQRVSFEAVGSRLGKEVDPLITIRDQQNRLIAQRDNDPGLFFDCRFSHQFAKAGIYTVELRDSRFQGHEHGFYVLRMGRFPAARVAVPAVLRPGKRCKLLLPEIEETIEVDASAALPAGQMSLSLRGAKDEGSTWLPVEVGDVEPTVAAADALTAKTGTPAKVPGQLCGVIAKPGQRHFFRLDLTKGQTIHVIGHGRRLNSPIEIALSLTDDQGRTLRQANESADDTVRLDFTAPKEGVYCLAVRDSTRDGGPACAYRIEVRDTAPPPVVTAEVEGLTIPRESYQPIPLTVARNGYAGPIALTLAAPAGVTLTPNEIPAGVEFLVCKLSASSSAPLGLHTMRIFAQAIKATNAPKVRVRTRPMIDRQLLNVDLIPYSLREDQRRLPPSLCDRFALQVTEPAPFTFELAETRIVLPRYQQAPIPIITTRKPGFEGAISFTARGGQLADKAEGRTRVYAELPLATAKALRIAGSIHSRILTNLGKTRIEVLASATHAGRAITLIRTFELETRTAFTVKGEPIKVARGSTARTRLKVDRVKSFAGPVTVELSPSQGLEFPEKVVIPKGKDSVEIEVKALPDVSPGKRNILLSATADVDGFEEEERAWRLEVEVPKPEAPKKK